MNEPRNLIEQQLTHHQATSASAITQKPLSAELADVVLDCCLTWLPEPREVLHLSKPPRVSSAYRIDGILGFAFGNRLDSRGGRVPWGGVGAVGK